MGNSATFYVPAALWPDEPSGDGWYPNELVTFAYDDEAFAFIRTLPRQEIRRSVCGDFVRGPDGERHWGWLNGVPSSAGDDEPFAVRAGDLMAIRDSPSIQQPAFNEKRAAWEYMSVCPPETLIIVILSSS